MQPAPGVLRHRDVPSKTLMKGGQQVIFSWSLALGYEYFSIILNIFFDFLTSLHLDETLNVEYIDIGSNLRLANNGTKMKAVLPCGDMGEV